MRIKAKKTPLNHSKRISKTRVFLLLFFFLIFHSFRTNELKLDYLFCKIAAKNQLLSTVSFILTDFSKCHSFTKNWTTQNTWAENSNVCTNSTANQANEFNYFTKISTCIIPTTYKNSTKSSWFPCSFSTHLGFSLTWFLDIFFHF